MRKTLTILAVMLAVFALGASSVMAEGGKERNAFSYFYQWLRDDDGDGIPNCLDPDYVRPEDGSGYGRLGPSYGTGAGECPGTGDCDGTPDRIRIRDQKRDGTCDGDCFLYQHRNQRTGK